MEQQPIFHVMIGLPRLGRGAIITRTNAGKNCPGLGTSLPMADTEKLQDLERKIKELSVFHEVGKALTSTLDLSEVLQTIMEKISSFFRPDTWSLLMVDDDTNELYFEIAIGEGAEALRHIRLKKDEGIAGWVATRGE